MGPSPNSASMLSSKPSRLTLSGILTPCWLTEEQRAYKMTHSGRPIPLKTPIWARCPSKNDNSFFCGRLSEKQAMLWEQRAVRCRNWRKHPMSWWLIQNKRCCESKVQYSRKTDQMKSRFLPRNSNNRCCERKVQYNRNLMMTNSKQEMLWEQSAVQSQWSPEESPPWQFIQSSLERCYETQ